MSHRPIPPDTILFWWTATIGDDIRNPDSIRLGKLLPPPDAPPDGSKGTASPIPQQFAAMPLAHRAYYPACYLPITYGDMAAYAQSRGEALGRENIQQRGYHVAAARVEAANHYLNWNQTASQRSRQLRKLKILAVLPTPKAAAALGIDTSPVFGEEPAPKYRGSAIVATRGEGGKAKARGRGGRAGGPAQPTLRGVVRREETIRRGYSINPDLHPTHQVVQTKHRPIPAPLIAPCIGDSIRPTLPIEEGDELLERVPGQSPTVWVDGGYNLPHSPGLPPDSIHLSKGIPTCPPLNWVRQVAGIERQIVKAKTRRQLRGIAKHGRPPRVVYCPADYAHHFAAIVADECGLAIAHLSPLSLAIVDEQGGQAMRVVAAQ